MVLGSRNALVNFWDQATMVLHEENMDQSWISNHQLFFHIGFDDVGIKPFRRSFIHRSASKDFGSIGLQSRDVISTVSF